MIKIDTSISKGLIQVFTGIPELYFECLVNRFEPLWEKSERTRLSKKERERAIGAGRKYTLNTPESKLFFYLLYCRHYVNQRVIGGLCGINQSNISILFRRVEKLVAEAADPQLKTFLNTIKEIREREGLTFAELKMLYPEMEKIITDVTEVRCNRPKDKDRRKNKTSGKKKQYSLKKQVSIAKNNRIIAISNTYLGKVHDFNIEKREGIIGMMPKESFQPVDLGYLGVNKIYPKHYVVIPPKRKPGTKLSPFLKDLKRMHSRQRIPVEHAFASIKRFSILKAYRGRDERFDSVFDNIAAIHNLCLGAS